VGHVRLGAPAALAVVAAAFAVSRATIAALGVHFDVSLVPWLWQLLDLGLLRHRLAESVWHLHSQPPLFNLAVGVGLKLFPGHFSGGFHALFLVLGLTAALSLEVLLERLGFRRVVAVALAVLISCAPWWLVYENWLYYEYPVMCLLIVAALVLTEFVRDWRLRWGIPFFLLLAVIVYTRASFQVVWMLLVVAVLVVVRRDAGRRILLAAAVPILLVSLLYAKNVVQFGVPSTTSWFGMNLARITLWANPQSETDRLVAEGKLSRVALVPPFSPLSKYDAADLPSASHTGIPALDRPLKANGGVNLNDKAYIELSRRYLKDSLRYIRYHPTGYLRGVAKAAGKLSVPATDYSYVYPQRSKIRAWDRVFNGLVYWRTPWTHGIGIALPLLYVLGVLFGLSQLVRAVRHRTAPGATLVVLFLWVTVTYLLLLASLTDFGENERVHLPIDPFVLVLAALAVRGVLRSSP